MNIQRIKVKRILITGLAVLVLAAVAIANDEKVHSLYGVASGDDETAYLGVQLREETEYAEGGARVTGVVDESPADEAGIEEDDIIVLFDGEVIRGPVALTQRIHAKQPGDAVSVTVVRDGKERRIEVELGARPDPLGLARARAPEVWTFRDDGKWKEALENYQERMEELGERLGEQYGEWSVRPAPTLSWGFFGGKPKLGVQLVESTPELRVHLGADEDEGVLVSKVLAGTPAERAGISVGDLIVEVDGESVASSGELVEALRDKGGETFPIKVIRDRREITVDVTIEEPEDSVPTGPRAFRVAPPPPVAPSVRPAPPPAPPAPPARVVARAADSV